MLHKAHVAGLGLVVWLFVGFFLSLLYQVESGNAKHVPIFKTAMYENVIRKHDFN